MDKFIEKVYKKNSLPSLRGGIKEEVIAFEKEKLSDITSPLTPLLKKGEGNKSGFTLQETLIALTILGVVAAITIPALIQKYIEATNRVKVKKAMAAYEKAVNHMVVENNISGSIKDWANEVANCANTNKYFKIINGGGCRFQTADKVWWDITDIEHPVIAFNEEDLDTEGAEGRFVLLAKNEDGILRIDDLNTVPISADEKEALEKLYAFVNGKKESASSSASSCSNGDLKCRYDTEKCNDYPYTNCIEKTTCEAAMYGAETCDNLYLLRGDAPFPGMEADYSKYIGYKTSSNGEDYIALEKTGNADAASNTDYPLGTKGNGEGTYILRSEKSDGTLYVSTEYEGQAPHNTMIGDFSPYHLNRYSEDPETHEVYKSMEEEVIVDDNSGRMVRTETNFDSSNNEISKKIHIYDTVTGSEGTCMYNYGTNEYESSNMDIDCSEFN